MKFKLLLLIILFFLFFNTSFAKILDIPFISQVLPGDWNSTLNCGQTSYYMADKFLSDNSVLDSEDIKKIDDFLYNEFSDPVRNYNGYYTNITKLKSVAENFGNYTDVFIHKSSDDFESIKNEIDSGNLIIPLVRISMKLDKDGHFMLMTGFDEKYVYFNDPGKTFGKNKEYLIDDFLNVWKSENYNYLLLKKKITPVLNNGVETQIVLPVQEVMKPTQIIPKAQNMYASAPVLFFTDVVSKIALSAGAIASNVSSIVSSIISNQNQTADLSPVVIPEPVVGYGYGDNTSPPSQNATAGEGGGSSNVVYLPEFEFKNNYKENKLVIPLEFNFFNVATDSSKYYFQMDYKINKDGIWNNLFNNYNSNYYKYYVKTNNDTYYFRLRVCDLNNYCSTYKEISQKVYLVPASDMTLIGYDGNDVVLDRPEYFNICFDIDPDQIVLITKGTVIKLTPYCTMSIKGFLFAMGEPDSRIKITATSSAYQNYWSFIKFENSFGSILNNVDVTYGGYYAPKGYTYPQFIIDNSIVTLNNVNFSDSMAQSAVYVQNNSAFYMLNSSIKDSKSYPGVVVKESIGVLDNNVFDKNLFGISLYDVDDRLTVSNNKISNSYFYPIYGENIFCNIKDNLFISNKYNIIFQDINLNKIGEYTLKKNVYEIRNANIGIGSVLNIENGSVFKFEKNNGNINVYGVIKAAGTASNPIVFTSVNDNEYGGVVNNNSSTIPVNGDWFGVNLNGVSNGSVFKNCIFRYGGYYNSQLSGMINIEGSSNVDISDSSFEKSYNGIKINNSNNINVENCSIKNNFYGIVVNASSGVTLKNNYYKGNLVNEMVN